MRTNSKRRKKKRAGTQIKSKTVSYQEFVLEYSPHKVNSSLNWNQWTVLFKLNQVYIWRLTLDCKKFHPKTLNKKPSNYSWQFLVKCSFIIVIEYEKEHSEHSVRLNSNSMVQWLRCTFCSKLKSFLSFRS